MILLPLLGYPNHPNVTSVIKYYEVHVIVLLEWIPQKGVLYNISTSPKVAVMTLSDTSVQFSASYNIHYNVSIVAASVCGQNMTVVDFHYSELSYHTHKYTMQLYKIHFAAACDYPLRIQEGNCGVNYNRPRPALVGTSITFDCPPGLELTGSESATCMENGEWEFDLRNITCSRRKPNKFYTKLLLAIRSAYHVNLLCNKINGKNPAWLHMTRVGFRFEEIITRKVLCIAIIIIIILLATKYKFHSNAYTVTVMCTSDETLHPYHSVITEADHEQGINL